MNYCISLYAVFPNLEIRPWADKASGFGLVEKGKQKLNDRLGHLVGKLKERVDDGSDATAARNRFRLEDNYLISHQDKGAIT